MAENQKERSAVAEKDTWDLSPLFSNDAQWEEAFDKLASLADPIYPLRNHLSETAENIAKTLRLNDALERELNRLFTYSHLKADEDTANSHYAAMKSRCMSRSVELTASLSWIYPEILAIPDDKLDQFQASPEMDGYVRELKTIRREKPHTLSEKEERLLSMVSEPLQTASSVFSMLNNADMTFPTIKDDKGKDIELTHGNFTTFLESYDRDVRASAFSAMYNTFNGVKNTLATTLDGDTRTRVFNAKVRNFDSALEASLHNDNVDPAVYNGLIEAVHGSLETFYSYIDIRRNQLNLDKLDIYDLYVPIVEDFDLKVDYEQAKQWVRDSLKPLGEEYCKLADKAFSERWIDVYENRGKRSGAYSSGCYDSPPYILMNYQPTLNSAFTLAHELGHSLHTWFSNTTQPHIYSNYKIFVAEVASTVNESLLMEHLLKTATDPQLKAYLLNHKCDGFRGTVFRQTMFAEFEKAIHQSVENGNPLTHESLSKQYLELVKKYHGPNVDPDERVSLEWARIPHFYYNFYVYKYATGYSAADAFSRQILSGEQKRIDQYLGFLKAGSSKDPLDILTDAGVDLRDPNVVANALASFGQRVEELGKTLKTLG